MDQTLSSLHTIAKFATLSADIALLDDHSMVQMLQKGENWLI